MRSIKYILVNDKTNHKTSVVNSSDISIDNLGHHFVINSAGAVLNPIDVCHPGTFLEHGTNNLAPHERQRLSQCSIGIKYNGSLESVTSNLKHGTLNLELKSQLIHLLVKLRSRFPDAKILALDEIIPETRNLQPETRGSIHVRDAMNQLRRELSNYQ